MSAALEVLAASQGGPFTARQAWTVAGYSKGLIRQRVWSGEWIVLRRGIYVDRQLLEGCGESDGRRHAVSVAAALLAFGSHSGTASTAITVGNSGNCGNRGWPPLVVGSHHSAARLLGIDLLSWPDAPTLTRLPKAPGTKMPPGVQLYRSSLPERHVSIIQRVPVTSPARTVVDLARALPFVDAVVAADAALRARITNPPELRNVLGDCRHWPGVRYAAKVVEFADPWAESVLESIARVVFAEHELPAPQTQVPIIDGASIVARVDFYWKQYRTIAETDGLLKYTSADVLRAEKLRQERLADLGYEIVRITWPQITKQPAETAARIRRAFARAARL